MPFHGISADFAVLRDLSLADWGSWPDLDDFLVFLCAALGGYIRNRRLPPCKPCNGLASAAAGMSLVRAACCSLPALCAA